MTGTEPIALDLTGLTAGPSQVWGGIRLVPLLRAEPVTDLRLHRQVYGDGPGLVELGPRDHYLSYIPHGFVADYRPSYRKDAAEDGWNQLIRWFKKYGVLS